MLKDGVLLVLVASIWFSASMSMIKALGPEVPVEWVSFLRNAVALPVVAFVMYRRGISFASSQWLPLVLRGCFGVLSMTCRFWALPRMPLADSTLISSTTPVFAAIWGVLFLEERLDRVAVLCIGATFVGVYVTFRPELSYIAAPYFAALAAGLFSSIAFAVIKSLSRSEPTERIIFYFAVVGSLAFLVPVLRSGFWPTPVQWAIMTAIGFAATGGQVFLTMGIGRAPVSRSSTGILFVIVLNIGIGWFFWGESPDAWTWLGCLLIAGGILGLTSEVRRRLLVTFAH
ncbi:DMT family transporter [Elusimicrobiota bacterium]